ncbi:MAG TPA: hypothetical protein PL033_07490 [Candidatus Brocadiia bacterium]|nr:hypothetical protein [Candidatus Brocadiia bacterium]
MPRDKKRTRLQGARCAKANHGRKPGKGRRDGRLRFEKKRWR